MSILRRMEPEELLKFFEEDMKGEMDKLKSSEWYAKKTEELINVYQSLDTSLHPPADGQKEEQRLLKKQDLEASMETYLMMRIALECDAAELESAKKSVINFLADETWVKTTLVDCTRYEIYQLLLPVYNKLSLK